jgi:hypothetical protein
MACRPTSCRRRRSLDEMFAIVASPTPDARVEQVDHLLAA